MPTANTTYFNRTMTRLYGTIEGLTIDCRLNEKEIAALYNWMESHVGLIDYEPFKGLWNLLLDILEDQIIDREEKEELLEWCADTINERGFLKDFTHIVRTLHGVIGGIIADERITADELEGLQDWLIDYEYFQDWWPLNQLNQLIEHVLKDGKIDKAEYKLLTAFFNDFAEMPINTVILHDDEYMFEEHMRSVSPFFQPISSICETKPEICFKGKKFCFTGPAKTGKRKDLSSMVQKLGGCCSNTIVKDLDYLIIGAQSSPAWIYSTYGRKIEKAMENNKTKKSIFLIQEEDFVLSAMQVGGSKILPDPKNPPFILTY